MSIDGRTADQNWCISEAIAQEHVRLRQLDIVQDVFYGSTLRMRCPVCNSRLLFSAE